MERIASSALNRSSGELIARAEAGEGFELTRHGKVVARLLPPDEKTALADTQVDVTDASHPARRPVAQPLSAQQQRDDLLAKINRSKR